MKKKFAIKLTKPIVGKRFGVFQHIMKWAGSDKVDMRKYSSGDSASQINWKLSAKYQELYTNIFQQEKSLQLDFFFDINYNRRGGEYPNVAQVRSYGEDIISYCKKQQIGIKFFVPTSSFWWKAKLIEKNMQKHNKDEIISTLHEILLWVKKTKKIYSSLLITFLETAAQNKQRRAIVIFSDFLALDEEAKKLVHYLKKHHILFLFQLPIDPEQGQNYSSFFLEKKSALTKKPSGEIELLQID